MTVEQSIASRGRARNWRRGDLPSAKKLNETVNQLNRERRVQSLPSITDTNSKLRIIRCRFVSESDNYITCKLYQADELTDILIDVAKPDDLQRLEYEGFTIDGVSYSYTNAKTREASKATDSETQIINPAYSPANGVFLGSVVWAERLPHVYPDLVNSINEPLIYIDVNRSGRAWAKQAE